MLIGEKGIAAPLRPQLAERISIGTNHQERFDLVLVQWKQLPFVLQEHNTFASRVQSDFVIAFVVFGES